MYHKASIAKLSEPQIQKLLRGQSVRVKHGNGHEVNLSVEQYKKLHKAHAKGAGITLSLDPYQCDDHMYLHGQGIRSAIKKVGHFVKQHKEHFRPLANSLKEHGHNAIADASMYALENGIDPNLVHSYGNMAHDAVGGSLKSFMRSPGMRTVRRALKPLGQTLLNDTLGLANEGLAQGMTAAQGAMASGMGFCGLGVHKKGRPKHHKRSGKGLYPAGY